LQAARDEPAGEKRERDACNQATLPASTEKREYDINIIRSRGWKKEGMEYLTTHPACRRFGWVQLYTSKIKDGERAYFDLIY
jgi:hypothetical protein